MTENDHHPDVNEDIETLWHEEIKSRIDSIESGEVKAVSWEKVIEQLNRNLK